MIGNIRDKLRERWENASQEEKRKIVLSVVILVVLVIGVLGYSLNRGGKTPQPETSDRGISEIRMQTDVVSRTQYVEMAKMYEELKRELEDLKRKNEEIESEKRKLEEEIRKGYSTPPVPPPPPTTVTPPPPPPPPPSPSPQGYSPNGVTVGEVKPKPEIVGSIAMVRGEASRSEEAKEGNVTSQGVVPMPSRAVKKKYYLTASFMEATLLSGLDAPAMSKGEGHPVPCLFRIKTPAILPNEVKANLRGCFVIGEGLGNLASERADIRLVSISCIDKQGRALIDERIKGFVVDSDGKIGLRGRVVSKMGSVLARSFLAGFIGGLGNMFGGAYGGLPGPIIVTPEYGKDTSIGTGMIRGGLQTLGSGISQASQELVRFYLELAKQSIPVVEVLPTRNVTLVITEGVWLNLKDLESMTN